MASLREALAASPVTDADGDDKAPESGVALCLSGGGYRAMLFHVGALWRLNELAYLSKLDRVSSVSGGSLTAATLGRNWGELDFDEDGVVRNFVAALVSPVRRLATKTIDGRSIIGGLLTPRRTIGDRVAAAYNTHLFQNVTLQGLPDYPRFVINATNVQTGSLWRFSKPYMADYRVGVYPDPDVELAVAAAASSAFPPVLSPVRLSVDPTGYSQEGRGPHHMPPYTDQVVLSDGGVYDNLGLETAWKRYTTILVSDGGGQMTPEPKVHADWARHALRVTSVIDNQVRSLRKQQTIAGFERGDRAGAYWGIRSRLDRFAVPGGGLPCPPGQTVALASVKTRLRRMPDELQERLINWGYAICDAAMRTHVLPDEPALPEDRLRPSFPYPRRGVG
jgi:NTE family protein